MQPHVAYQGIQPAVGTFNLNTAQSHQQMGQQQQQGTIFQNFPPTSDYQSLNKDGDPLYTVHPHQQTGNQQPNQKYFIPPPQVPKRSPKKDEEIKSNPVQPFQGTIFENFPRQPLSAYPGQPTSDPSSVKKETEEQEAGSDKVDDGGDNNDEQKEKYQQKPAESGDENMPPKTQKEMPQGPSLPNQEYNFMQPPNNMYYPRPHYVDQKAGMFQHGGNVYGSYGQGVYGEIARRQGYATGPNIYPYGTLQPERSPDGKWRELMPIIVYILNLIIVRSCLRYAYHTWHYDCLS